MKIVVCGSFGEFGVGSGVGGVGVKLPVGPDHLLCGSFSGCILLAETPGRGLTLPMVP